jgi:hypothetical protein
MPQFDAYTYSSQIFWVLIGFYLFYFFFLNYYLISFSEVFKMRLKLISFYSKKRKGTLDAFSPFLHAIFKKV